MPTWLKVVLICIVAMVLAVVAGGWMVVKAVQRGAEATERAAEQGKTFGSNSTLSGCTAEGVRLAGACDSGLTCSVQIHTFLWGCLEAAPADASFCAPVPSPHDDAAIMNWTRATCARHGVADHEICQFSLTAVPAFCSSL